MSDLIRREDAYAALRGLTRHPTRSPSRTMTTIRMTTMTKITITNGMMTKLEALTMPMPMKIEMRKSTTKTDGFIKKLANGYDTCWYDFDDKSTWFQDDALTVPALQREDVRYVKNKAGPGYMKIVRVEKDTQGRHYAETSSSVSMYTFFITDKQPPLDDLEAIEQRFMRDMGICPKE